jgi:hypothetical protein
MAFLRNGIGDIVGKGLFLTRKKDVMAREDDIVNHVDIQKLSDRIRCYPEETLSFSLW